MILRLNIIYVTLVAMFGGAALMLISWAVVTPVYDQWWVGARVFEAYELGFAVVVILICFFLAFFLAWKIYADAKTTISESGVARPSFRGMARISWSEVTRIDIFGGVGLHIYSNQRKIVISPFAYQAPEQIVDAVWRCYSASRSTDAGRFQDRSATRGY